MTKEFRQIGKSSTANLVTKGDKDRYWKRILIVDDDVDIATTFKIGIESTQLTPTKRLRFIHIMILEKHFWISNRTFMISREGSHKPTPVRTYGSSFEIAKRG